MERGLRLEGALVRVARGRGVLDLAVGESLRRLCGSRPGEGDRLLRLGYARQVDYARERLGVPARTMFSWLALARGLADRPVLRRAVVAGAVSPRAARTVLPVATGPDEARWTAAAMSLTLARLEQAVRAAGSEVPAVDFEVETLQFAMSPAQQDRLDAALTLAQEVEGPAAPRWQRLEAICQEWLGTFGAWQPDADGRPPTEPESEPRVCADAVARQLQALEEAHGVAAAEGPDESRGPDDALAHDARLQRLLAARKRYDLVFGALATRFLEGRIWAALGYRSLEEYCRERLGVSVRSVRQRAWLERRMRALPVLREAMAAGRITYSKALLVAKNATPRDVADRIEGAAATTWQQLERDSTAREDRQNRAAGVRRVWGPADATRTVVAAIASARACLAELVDAGARVDDGEALAVIADHFVAVWSAHRKRPPRRRREVLMRHGGFCAVPGCTRPAEHIHHVTFRSHGGPSVPWNELGVCCAHHLHGIHRGYLTVAGRAGERLVWRLGIDEVWITEGDNDVRRAG